MKNIIDAVVTLIKRNNFKLPAAHFGNNRANSRGDDAVEVKKIESADSALALNSSYPKHTLKSSSPLISRACRKAEDWSEKEIIYTVGVVNGNKLKHLCMVYGQDYCASDECYDKIRQRIKDGVESIPCVEFIELQRNYPELKITEVKIRSSFGNRKIYNRIV